MLDATERGINRPKYHQEFYYSGKKKYHTVKNQIYVNPKSKKILAVSDTVEGKRHDKQLACDDPTLYAMPPNSKLLADLGYMGLDKDQPRIDKCITPCKKPKGKELSQLQRKTNKIISGIRVSVKHPFAFMKNYHILQHQFRGRVKHAHKPFINLARIYNFNLAYK